MCVSVKAPSPPPAPEPVRLPANWPFTHLAQTLGG